VIAAGLLLTGELQDLYRGDPGDPDFAAVMGCFPVEGDAELADLIEAEGRLRIRLNRPVPLDRYLEAVADLRTRPEPLDAAIDMALRSMARSGEADESAIELLIGAHPELEGAIREAAALSNALWSTARVQEHLALSTVKDLPCDFGPLMEDGVRRYELRELLGEGAAGQVYLGVDRQLSEKDHPALVAVKVLPGEHRSGWARQQLTDEATKARRISHANVARVLDRGVSGRNADFVVYEHVEGGDLGRWVRRRGRLELGEAVDLAARISRGVQAAHMAGLVHCDLKPNNILMTGEGEPKVADFGIAIRSEEAKAERELEGGEGELLGNLAFMSPEQYRMEPGALTIPTDVYALGGMLYWLVTGSLPNGVTPEEIGRTHDEESGRREAPRLREKRSEADRDLEAICQRAMASEREWRYDSAASLAEDLERWQRREPIGWRRPSVLRRVRLWSRRRPAAAWALGAAVVVVAASSVGLVHTTSLARARQLEAAVAQARLEEQELRSETIRQMLSNYNAILKAAQAEGLSEQVFAGIWVGEWLFGPETLGEEVDRFELWRIREATIRDLLARAEAAGRGDDVEMLMWETSLCFWLVKEGEYVESEELIARNHGQWEALLESDDAWLDWVKALEACARVNRAVALGGEGVDLVATADALERSEAMLREQAPESSLHRLVLERLVTVYGAGLLDRPQRRGEVSARLESYRE